MNFRRVVSICVPIACIAAVRIFIVESSELYLDLFADGGTIRFRVARDD